MPFQGGGEDDVFLDPGAVDIPDEGSGPWSGAPDPSTPPDADVTPNVETEVSQAEPLPEFDPRYREDYEGLMYVGYLKTSFSFLGHRFSIRTLDVDAILEVGMLHRPYQGTIGDLKAYQACLAAASVTMLDGRPLAVPMGLDERDLEARFNVVRKWFPATLDKVYTEYLLLEDRVDKVIAAMQAGHLLGGASGEVGSTPGLKPVSA